LPYTSHKVNPVAAGIGLGIVLLGASSGAGWTAPAPQSARSTDATRLLRQMLTAENSLALAGQQTTTLTRGGREITTQQNVLRSGSRALRVDYVQPPRFAGEQIVDNGHLYRHYVPSANTLEIGPSRMQRLRRRVPQVMERIRRGALLLQLMGTETVAGHACAVVQVKPRSAAPAAWRRFWIDTTTGAQLRIEQYNRNGQRVSVSSYTSIVYNPPMDKQSFRAPVTPRTVRVVALDPAPPLPTIAQAQATGGFPVREPAYLPLGFRFQSASVADYRGKKLVTLRYVNGLNTLSLFETPQARERGNPKPMLAPHPRRSVAQAFQAGLRLILVGNLVPDEMQRVLDSLH